MQKAKIIKVAESLPIQTEFEKSIIKYWTGQRYGNINVGLLEKIKISKQNGKGK